MTSEIRQMLKARGHSDPQKGSQMIQLAIPLNEPTIEARKRVIKEFFEQRGFRFVMERQSAVWTLLFDPPTRIQDETTYDGTVRQRMLVIPKDEVMAIIRSPEVRDFLHDIGAKVVYDKKTFTWQVWVVLDPTTEKQKESFYDIGKGNLGGYVKFRPDDYYHGR